VTRSLGYQPNGVQIDDREGLPVRHLRFVLARDDWRRLRRDDITIENRRFAFQRGVTVASRSQVGRPA
jgi:extradiol dioxygenase family protein